MSGIRAGQLVNILALAAVVAFNFISQSLPLNGQTSAEIANRYSNMLYFPANYAFSIWGVIYTFLIIFGVYQALPSQRDNPAVQRIGYLFAASSVFNIAWLTCFHYNQFALSMVMMLLLLGTLLAIYIRLGIGVSEVSRVTKIAIHVPFSIYIGWITAATIANAGYLLVDAGWDGFGISSEVWAVIMLTVTGIVAAGMVWLRRDIAYGLVIVWAVSAIAVRHGAISSVAVAAVAVAGLTAVLVVLVALRMFGGGSSPAVAGSARA
ncbi:MAG: tryptophan-rich sensory protein [Chloroflexi bacterium]|nr:tryptophan-rich sensory protein [Chloroflexota bacterium]